MHVKRNYPIYYEEIKSKCTILVSTMKGGNFDYPVVKRILKAIPDQQINRYIERWAKKKQTKKYLK